jgi:hypothetical protein
VVLGACPAHHQETPDASGTGIDAAPPTCPAPITEDSADHSTHTNEQLIPAPSAASGSTILVLGMPDAGGYASLTGYQKITGLPPNKEMNISLVMGTTCTPACSPMVEMLAGSHPNFVLLGDDYAGGCDMGGSTPTDPQGGLELYEASNNNGPNYGYLIQVP